MYDIEIVRHYPSLFNHFARGAYQATFGRHEDSKQRNMPPEVQVVSLSQGLRKLDVRDSTAKGEIW